MVDTKEIIQETVYKPGTVTMETLTAESVKTSGSEEPADMKYSGVGKPKHGTEASDMEESGLEKHDINQPGMVEHDVQEVSMEKTNTEIGVKVKLRKAEK